MTSNDRPIDALLYREARCLDTRNWDEWLDLMAPDVEYWIPAWDTDLETTGDPNNELSLVYYDSRQGLEDRVFRIRTGRSVATTPLPRTCHYVTNIETQFEPDPKSCRVHANWQVNSWRLGKTNTYFGYYEYLLIDTSEGWKIRRKKITVLNEVIPTVLDIYLV